MKNPWVIIGIITVVLFGGAIVYSNQAGKKSNEGVVAQEHKIEGAPGAVVLTEYSDFQCPACGAFEPVLEEVLAKYGDKITFEYKHYPLPIHPYAEQAALAAEAAGQQGKFFDYHHKLFAAQEEWANAAVPQTLFVKYATNLGLDVEKFRTHMRSSILRDAVRADANEARELGLTGTPTFFLNGQKMEMKSYEDFVNQIAAAVDPASVVVTENDSTTPEAAVPADIKFGI
jgi:protein-disulfide isomerase